MPLQEFSRWDDRLCCEKAPLDAIAADAGTPVYVYSSKAIRDNYRGYAEAVAGVPHGIHYAVKANSSLGVLALLAREGSGFDIVSGGELYRVLRAGGAPEKIVFSGVGKSREEIRYALESRIGSFNCESRAELELLREEADRAGARPKAALRVNPDVNADTHPYIATGLAEHKFGVDLDLAEAIYREDLALSDSAVALDGVSCHIGSQIFDTGAFVDALERVLALIGRLRAAGATIRRLDLGGGLGVSYEPGQPSPSIADYGRRISARLDGQGLELQLEPGRSIVGPAGALVTRVLYRKRGGTKVFVVVDAAMNDLIRPALYQSHHEVMPVMDTQENEILADIVGPVCETGDFLARERLMPDVVPGDLLAVATAGAYGFVLSSNYNSRPRAAEVLVDGAEWRVIRKRETLEDLVRGETV